MNATEQGTPALVRQFADEIIARLAATYDLIYVDYRDELDDEQAAAVVRADYESLWDHLAQFESDSRYEGVKYVIDELVTEVIREWDIDADADLDFIAEAFKNDPDEWDRVRYAIEERDDGSWLQQLMRQTPNVLLRINVIDEDNGYSFEEVKPRRVLKDIGMPATRANVETVERTLLECSPEYSVLLGYWIVGADLGDIYELPNDPDTEVEITNPYLYLGNPFSGSGFISERPIEGTVRVKRGDLRTDADAFGYGVDEIYGGLYASSFECKIEAVN